MGVPVVFPSKTPDRISTVSVSCRGEVSGDVPGDLGGVLRRVEPLRLHEDRPQRVGVSWEIDQVDAVALRIREVAVVQGAVEGGVDVEAVAEVAGDEDRRRTSNAAAYWHA